MSLAVSVLSLAVAAMIAVLWASLAASLLHFRRRPSAGAGPLLPMTLIKPVRGLDDGMRENFESIAASDPGRSLQIIIAIESPDDPAAAVARGFCASHPDRDIVVLYTGPAGERMGKVHNMIEAEKKAKHPRLIFSDADTTTTEALLRETSQAFAEGFEAVFGLPYHVPASGSGGWMFRVAFNHTFCVGAALSYYAGQFRFCAGAWMAYTKDALDRAGGLEPLAHAIADDFAISSRVRALGARQLLLRELVPVSETGTGLFEAFWHLCKWCSIIRWSLPALYAVIPLFNMGVIAALLLVLCERSGDGVRLGRGLFAAAAGSRILVGFLQDRLVARVRPPWWDYPSLAFVDIGGLLFWPFGLRRRILWRGVRYRLSEGGIAEVVGESVNR
ncbi:MAG: glycosyltransferase [Elusimicrobia bacterium]|nr:glycosyltransferase [Elusimicrobiota bacterium]